MLIVATLLWTANENSLPFSRMYDEFWVEKLHAGFRRHLTVPFRFVCYTDKERKFTAPEIEQRRLSSSKPTYEDCLQPYEMGEPMILVGLDTLVVGNIDHLAAYCLQKQPTNVIGLPRDPYYPHQACNGVALVPKGKSHVWTRRVKGMNDMDGVRRWPHAILDDIFPGHVVSYKKTVKGSGLGDARIVYFHGVPKMHQMLDDPLVKEHWRI